MIMQANSTERNPTVHHLTEPCPASAVIDPNKVTQWLGDFMAEDPGWHHDLEHNELSWVLEGFDPGGWAELTVVHKRTGKHIASATAHWSVICETLK